MRVRKHYTIRGKVWTTKWHEYQSVKYVADMDWTTRTIRLDARFPERPDLLEHALRHELLHILLEAPSNQERPHYLWTFRHDYLTKITMKLDLILRTGTDVRD